MIDAPAENHIEDQIIDPKRTELNMYLRLQSLMFYVAEELSVGNSMIEGRNLHLDAHHLLVRIGRRAYKLKKEQESK